MNPICKKIVDEIIEREGGYVNSPDDSGGETNFGITVSLARRYGYTGEMRSLPRSTAVEIYRAEFWDKLKCDFIFDISPQVCAEVIDTGVNMGAHFAIVSLQRSLNVLNRATKLYLDLKVDGKIGPITLSSLEAYCLRRSPLILVRALDCLQGARYIELAERKEKDEEHVYGWLSNRVGV